MIQVKKMAVEFRDPYERLSNSETHMNCSVYLLTRVIEFVEDCDPVFESVSINSILTFTPASHNEWYANSHNSQTVKIEAYVTIKIAGEDLLNDNFQIFFSIEN